MNYNISQMIDIFEKHSTYNAKLLSQVNDTKSLQIYYYWIVCSNAEKIIPFKEASSLSQVFEMIKIFLANKKYLSPDYLEERNVYYISQSRYEVRDLSFCNNIKKFLMELFGSQRNFIFEEGNKLYNLGCSVYNLLDLANNTCNTYDVDHNNISYIIKLRNESSARLNAIINFLNCIIVIGLNKFQNVEFKQLLMKVLQRMKLHIKSLTKEIEYFSNYRNDAIKIAISDIQHVLANYRDLVMIRKNLECFIKISPNSKLILDTYYNQNDKDKIVKKLYSFVEALENKIDSMLLHVDFFQKIKDLHARDEIKNFYDKFFQELFEIFSENNICIHSHLLDKYRIIVHGLQSLLPDKDIKSKAQVYSSAIDFEIAISVVLENIKELNVIYEALLLKLPALYISLYLEDQCMLKRQLSLVYGGLYAIKQRFNDEFCSVTTELISFCVKYKENAIKDRLISFSEISNNIKSKYEVMKLLLTISTAWQRSICVDNQNGYSAIAKFLSYFLDIFEIKLSSNLERNTATYYSINQLCESKMQSNEMHDINHLTKSFLLLEILEKSANKSQFKAFYAIINILHSRHVEFYLKDKVNIDYWLKILSHQKTLQTK